MVVWLEWGADLHTAQLMPLPLTVSCFSKIQIRFTFLVPAHPGCPGQMAVKHVCVPVVAWQLCKLLYPCYFTLLTLEWQCCMETVGWLTSVGCWCCQVENVWSVWWTFSATVMMQSWWRSQWRSSTKYATPHCLSDRQVAPVMLATGCIAAAPIDPSYLPGGAGVHTAG